MSIIYVHQDEYLTLVSGTLTAFDNILPQDTGPWLDPSVVDAALDPIKAILPKMSTSWLPFKYNLKHVRLHEK